MLILSGVEHWGQWHWGPRALTCRWLLAGVAGTAGTLTEGQGEVRVCGVGRNINDAEKARPITQAKSLLKTNIAVALLGQLKWSSFWPQSAPIHLERHSDNAKLRTRDEVSLLTLRPLMVQ